MWMLPLYLHVNQKSNNDDGMYVFIALKGHTFYNLFTLARKQGFAKHSSSLNKYGNDGKRGISIVCCHSHLRSVDVLCKAQQGPM